MRYRATDRNAPQMTSFGVEPTTYDRLAVGAPLAVRYPPNRYLRDLLIFSPARPADQSTLSWLRAIVPSGAVRAIAPILIGLVLFVLWRALRGRVRGLGWLLAAYALGAALSLVAPAPDLGGGRDLRATATVRAVHPVKYVLRPRSGATNKAVRVFQPYELVELQFVPAGQTDPVVAVEAVDTDSVASLAAGQAIPVTYAAHDPRGARLVGGRQTYAWKNLLGLAAVGLVLTVLSIVGYILSSSIRRRVRAGAVALHAAGEAGRRRRGR